jgi:alanyl-tRNA synthetase
MRAHTATHLLHFALGKILWNTKQAWSWVDSDQLRFDFASTRALENHELTMINNLILSRIQADIPVQIEEMLFSQASTLWAKAFFEDKYGDLVRVVSITTTDETLHSVELCGWTHVQSTWHIWSFSILEQESVASGTRRIIACTWPQVAYELNATQSTITKFAELLWCQPKQIEEKIEKILMQNVEVQRTNEWLETKYYTLLLNSLPKVASKISMVDTALNLTQLWLNEQALKPLLWILKIEYQGKNMLVYTQEGSYGLRVDRPWMSAKTLAKERWLAWWWSDHLVQGKDSVWINKICNNQ